jgi:hypothetical protein
MTDGMKLVRGLSAEPKEGRAEGRRRTVIRVHGNVRFASEADLVACHQHGLLGAMS